MSDERLKMSPDDAAVGVLRILHDVLGQAWFDRLQGWLARASFESGDVHALFDGTARDEALLASIALQLNFIDSEVNAVIASRVRKAILATMEACEPTAVETIAMYSELWKIPPTAGLGPQNQVAIRILERAGVLASITLPDDRHFPDLVLPLIIGELAVDAGTAPVWKFLRERVTVVPETQTKQQPRPTHNPPAASATPVKDDAAFKREQRWMAAIVLSAAGLLIWLSVEASFVPDTTAGGRNTGPSDSLAKALLAPEPRVVESQLNKSPTLFPPTPLPANGKVTRYHISPAIAPLRIVTASGSNHYFCKLVSIGASASTLTVFIHSGQSALLNVPTGAYELRYATGTNWYGEQRLFGPDTTYHKADDVLHFRQYGDRVSGYTIELYRQINGNLETHKIPASEF